MARPEHGPPATKLPTAAALTADLYAYEAVTAACGYRRVIGIDEAGRGPLAGPVVVAAVCLPVGKRIPGVNDSKQLSAAQRAAAYARLTADPSIRWTVAVMDVATIDRLNILEATNAGMRQVAGALTGADLALVDGNPVAGLPCPAVSVIKGDARCACIAAASIVAKVYRDRLMDDCERQFPGYGFAQHKGYGTRQHLEALRRLGPCPLHRRSFRPVAEADGRQGQLDLPG